ncbi:MAG: alpha/beta family hydrolase [Bacteroidota bacterium]
MKKIVIQIPEKQTTTSGWLHIPAKAKALLVLAHGAGAGMDHPFMQQLATDLSEQGIGTLRFNFIYMESGKRRPDSPKVAHAAIRAALATANKQANGLPIYLGGKSFGGRMNSQLAASESLDHIKGLIFFGFPLHATGKPGTDRAAHLNDVQIPMLFLQGTRDTLALPELIEPVCKGLDLATLEMYDGADHSFKMLKRSGVTQEEVIKKLAARVGEWLDA